MKKLLLFMPIFLSLSVASSVVRAYSSENAWRSVITTYSSLSGEKKEVMALVGEAPYLVKGYCVISGMLGDYPSNGEERSFTAISASEKDGCDKNKFPDFYSIVAGVDVEEAIDAFDSFTGFVECLNNLNWRKCLPGLGENEKMILLGPGRLVSINYFSLNKEPWSFMICEKGNFLINNSCTLFNVKISEGKISHLVANEIMH